eukprot:scaffold1390_cov249-Pinguiococcus_pyrenoidosus.AAC.2
MSQGQERRVRRSDRRRVGRSLHRGRSLGIRGPQSLVRLFPVSKMAEDHGDDTAEIREQDRFLPIANIARIMKRSLPENAKIAKDAKECVQECVSEFISFISSEASDKCQQEKRKTINGEDLIWAMSTLGFDNYVEPLKLYLSKYREGMANLNRSACLSLSTVHQGREARVQDARCGWTGGHPDCGLRHGRPRWLRSRGERLVSRCPRGESRSKQSKSLRSLCGRPRGLSSLAKLLTSLRVLPECPLRVEGAAQSFMDPPGSAETPYSRRMRWSTTSGHSRYDSRAAALSCSDYSESNASNSKARRGMGGA